MKKIGLCFLIICLFSCAEKVEKTVPFSTEQDRADTFFNSYAEADSLNLFNVEYLDWNTLRINSQLPFFTSKQALINLFGKVDSIITPGYDEICVSYFDSSFKYIYVGKSEFEIKDTVAVLSSIDFDSGDIKVVFPEITLDKSTTFSEIKKMFPNSAKEASQVIIEDNRNVLSVRIESSKKLSDTAWILIFANGRLIKFEHYMPC